MRILLLIHYWPPEVGAPQRRWNRLATSLVSRGHELAVLTPCPHYPGGRLLEDDVPHRPGSVSRDVTGAIVHRTAFRSYDADLRRRGADQLVAAADSVRLGVRRFSGANRPDVILGSVPGLPTLPAALALGRVLRRPVVVELRDAWPDLFMSAEQWDSSSAHAHRGTGAARSPRSGHRRPERAQPDPASGDQAGARSHIRGDDDGLLRAGPARPRAAPSGDSP